MIRHRRLVTDVILCQMNRDESGQKFEMNGAGDTPHLELTSQACPHYFEKRVDGGTRLYQLRSQATEGFDGLLLEVGLVQHDHNQFGLALAM